MKTITVIGLGAGDLDQLSLGTYRQLQQLDLICTRTKAHPVIQQLEEEGITFASYDDCYVAEDAFEDVYAHIVDNLLQRAERGPVYYAVPGHPLVAERTTQLLIERERQGDIQLHITGGQSFLDPMFSALRIDPIEGFRLIDSHDITVERLSMTEHMIIGQVYSSFVASDVKLTLMELFPDDYEVTLVTAAGTAEERLQTVPLYEIDRIAQIDNLTSLYVPPATNDVRNRDWTRLREVIQQLRSPEGCPWDREQTHETLVRHLLEEAHEVAQAIHEGDLDHLVEELGDVLLQVFLHAQIGVDDGYFALEDIVEAITKKMIHRHPHVFGQTTVTSSADVRLQWEQLKQRERPVTESILDEQYVATSSLLTSYNYQKKAASVGFNWSSIDGAIRKFHEEWDEFLVELESGTSKTQLDEFGDVLFTLIKIAQFLKISPEEAMVHANDKFARRFRQVEQLAKLDQVDLTTLTDEQLDQYWNQAKEMTK